MIVGLAQIPLPGTDGGGLNVPLALLIFGGWIASVCLHEFGHAIVAYWGGDISVKDKGYLTLNPLKYTDISLSLVVPLVFLALGGLALPGAAVYINTHLLRGRGWQSAMSAAGPFATALVALLLSIPFHLEWQTPDWWWQAIACLAMLQVTALCFNLLPIPSFDGFGIIEPWLPPTVQQQARQWGRYGFLIVIALLWTVPSASQVFWSLVEQLSMWFGIPLDYSRVGFILFRQASVPMLIGVAVIGGIIRNVFFRRSRQAETDEAPIEAAADPQADGAPTAADIDKWERELAAHDHALNSGTKSAAIWVGRAQLLRQLQRYQEAADSYGQALQLDPKHPEASRQQAAMFYQLGQYTEAAKSYQAVLKHHHPMAEDWHFYGSIQTQLDQYEDAIASYNHALELTPDRAALWYDRGLALYWHNDCDGALESFDRAVYLQPEHQEAWFRRGLVLNRLQRYDRALACFNQALSIADELPAVWAAKGLALLQLDQCEAAVAAHEKSVHLDPSDAHAWYNKACCHARLAETEQAIDSLDHAVKLNPEPTRELAIDDSDFDGLQAHPEFQRLVYVAE